jgi:Na+/H+ antiporter NhaD/arsenite permease-like protein
MGSLALTFGPSLALSAIAHTLFHEYFPFIIMIGALYTISGGIRLRVEASATPFLNTCFLALGTFVAGWIGTTGASMLLIRPLLHMNANRKAKVHHVIFFVFLVANMGGALTPLGDPPLFLGFLNGVSFSWPLSHLILDMLLMIVPLLVIFYSLDTFYAHKEGFTYVPSKMTLDINGAFNGLLFIGVLGLVVISGIWKPSTEIALGPLSLELQNIVRDLGLIGLALLSYKLTPVTLHEENHFSWEPFKEVAKLFLGIFITVIPVIAILKAGPEGALAPLIALVNENGVPQNAIYFWLSGGLSSFLDNAPTYLVFFHIAGGNADVLMESLPRTLAAISLGSVFMGAMTYIGNAPNFMVKTIAEFYKVPMPHFFGYLAWSCGILLPLFFLLAWVRF